MTIVITKQGKIPEKFVPPIEVKFNCENCGTEFTAGRSDFKVSKVIFTSFTDHIAIINCPLCNKSVSKVGLENAKP